MERNSAAVNPAFSARGGVWLKRREKYVVFAYLLALALLAYWPTLNNAFLGDDYFLVDLGRTIPLSDIWKLVNAMGGGFTRPLPLLTWWLHSHIFGPVAWPAHLFNVSLHTANAFLVFWLLLKVDARRVTAFFSATLFALAPIAPEVVTWPSGRFDGMALFFMLLAIGLYLSSIRNQRKLIFAGAMLAVIAALLSKEAALPILIVIPAVEVLYGRTSRDEDKRVLPGFFRLLTFFAVFAAYIKFRYFALKGMGGFSDSFDFSHPKLTAIRKTFGTILSPLNYFVFPKSTIIVLGSIVGFLLLLSLVLLLFRRREISADALKVWSLFLIFFLASLLPTYQSFFIYGISHHLMHSRFLYIPFMAFLVLLVVGVLEFSWSNRAWRLIVGGALSLLALFYFWGLTNNNQQWVRASQIATKIPEETVRLLPDPPTGAKLYFQRVPIWQGGAWVYVNGLDIAVFNKYGRDDLSIIYPPPIIEGANAYCLFAAGPKSEDTKDGYLFEWDLETEQLMLKGMPTDLDR